MLIAVSTGAAIVGWFLIVFGAACMVLGFIGAARALLTKPAARTMEGAGWGDIIAALLKAGPWGIVMGVGLAAFLAGCTLVGIKLEIPSG
jgi:hypothetical protein